MPNLTHRCPQESRSRSVHSGQDDCLACDITALESLAMAHRDHNKNSREQTRLCIARITTALSTRAEWAALVAELRANSERYLDRAHAAEAELAKLRGLTGSGPLSLMRDALAKIEAWCNNDERRIELFRWMRESGVFYWRCDTRDNEDNLDLTTEFAGPDLAAMLADVGEWCAGHMGSVFDRRSEP